MLYIQVIGLILCLNKYVTERLQLFSHPIFKHLSLVY